MQLETSCLQIPIHTSLILPWAKKQFLTYSDYLYIWSGAKSAQDCDQVQYDFDSCRPDTRRRSSWFVGWCSCNSEEGKWNPVTAQYYPRRRGRRAGQVTLVGGWQLRIKDGKFQTQLDCCQQMVAVESVVLYSFVMSSLVHAFSLPSMTALKSLTCGWARIFQGPGAPDQRS